MDASNDPPPIAAKRGIITAVICLGISLHAIDIFIVSTVLPTVVAELGGAGFYTWSAMTYMIASIMGAASGGPVKVILGNRKGFVVAAALFFIGTLLCGVAPTMAFLLLGRLVQGYGGGLIMAQSLGLVGEYYPGHQRVRMLTIISGVWAVAALLGPLVGGVFAEIGWWRGAFIGPLPVIAGFGLAAWHVLPSFAQGGEIPRFPIRRLGLLALGVMGVGLAGHLQMMAVQIALIVAAAMLVGVTLKLDAGAANPLFPSRPLSWRSPVGASNCVFFLHSMTHVAIGIFLPLLVQQVHGVTPLVAGYFNAALAVGWTLGSLVTQNWRGRAEDAAILGGLALTSLGSIGLAIGAVSAPPIALAVLSALIGIGIGASNIHLMANAMRLAAPGEESLTASSVPTMRSLGIAFGAAAAGVVANANGLAAGVDPSRVAAAVGAVYAASVLAPVLSLLFAARVQTLRRRMGDR